ncbi:MAG TPA: ATP-binding protein [Pseudogracilibacillus sp.]|nr:ATP-binding protein [Pseudogracilibacillus sp.]
MFTNAKEFIGNLNELSIDNMMHMMLDEQEDIVWLLMDEEEIIVAHSPTIHRYEGFSRNIETEKKLQDVVPENIYHILSPEEMVESSDVSTVELGFDDSVYYFEMKRRKLIVNNESFVQIILKDITYIKQLEQKVYENEKTMQSAIFAMGMIHEFRNPLTSIRGFLQLLQAGVKQEAAYYNVMINEVDKLEQISNSLLQLSKPYESKQDNVAVSSLMEDVIFLFQTQVMMRDVLFQVDIEEDMICHCNTTQIKQVFLNLIKNAAEAIEYDGLIQIKAYKTEDEEQAVIEIIDNGVGVSEDIVREMRTPFYSTKKDGTGLGLAISYGLLDEHGGTLTFANRDHGGMIATITLPII